MDTVTHYAWQDTTNFTSTSYLHINSCGRQNHLRCNNGGKGYTLLRENGRVDYHILFITAGECMLPYAGQRHLLRTGDGILYKPHERQEYTFPGDSDTATCWIHFSGTAAEDILRQTGLWENTFFHLQHPKGMEDLFKQLIQEQRLGNAANALLSNSLFLRMLAYITQNTGADHQQGTAACILPALADLQDHPEHALSLTAYAAMCHLSKSRFLHLFTDVVGVSPVHYRLQLRINRAKELLAYSDMSVTAVAAAVGFDDPLYFSRVFCKYTNLSPRAYRLKGKTNT